MVDMNTQLDYPDSGVCHDKVVLGSLATRSLQRVKALLPSA